MERQTALKLQLELVWWIITGIAAYLVVMPMINNFEKFEFLFPNILFVVVFATFTRYIFFLKHTFIAHFRPAKAVLIFGSIPLIFILIEDINGFQSFLDNRGLVGFDEYFKEGVDGEKRHTLLEYLRREIIFFGTASVITTALMPFRMIISVWRVYNKTGKV